MTVNNTASSVAFTGNGVTTIFPYTFRIPEDDMSHVAILDIATSVLTELLPSDYVITGIGSDFGGTVTYNPLGVPLPATKRIVIYRELDLIQEMDLTDQSPYYAATLEETLDRIVMMMQQVSAEADRSVKTTLGTTTDPDALIAALFAAEANAAASAAAAQAAVVGNIGAAVAAAANLATPADADLVSTVTAAGLLRNTTWAQLKSAFFTALGPLIAAATAKATPVVADGVLITDSAAAGANKFLSFTNFIAFLSGYFPRFDAAQPVVLTQTQKGQFAANAGQAWELIGAISRVNSAVATLPITGLLAYREIKITYRAVPVTDGQPLLLQLGVSGVYNTTVGAYELQFMRANNATIDASRSSADPGFPISASAGNLTNEGASGVVVIKEFNQNRNAILESDGGYVDASGLIIRFDSYQRFIGTGARDSLRFLFASGNIAEGSFIVEGIRG